MPFPPTIVVALTADGSGAAKLADLAGGGGPATLYAQAAYYDPFLPQAFGFSNALEIELWP